MRNVILKKDRNHMRTVRALIVCTVRSQFDQWFLPVVTTVSRLSQGEKGELWSVTLDKML